MADNTENYTDEELEAQKDREDKAKRVRENQLVDLRDLLDSQVGRRFIKRVLDQTHPFQTSIGDNMREREGERNIGLWLWSEIMEAYPGIIPELLQTDYGNL